MRARISLLLGKATSGTGHPRHIEQVSAASGAGYTYGHMCSSENCMRGCSRFPAGRHRLRSCRHVWRFMLPAADQAGNPQRQSSPPRNRCPTTESLRPARHCRNRQMSAKMCRRTRPQDDAAYPCFPPVRPVVYQILHLEQPSVRSRNNSLGAAMSAVGLGCVKTCAREERAELFSLSSTPDSGRQRSCSLD